MDLRKLKTLIDLVSDSNVSELEITEAEGKVRIVKGGQHMMVQQGQPMMMATPSHMPQQPMAHAVAPPSTPVVADAPAGHVVK